MSRRSCFISAYISAILKNASNIGNDFWKVGESFMGWTMSVCCIDHIADYSYD